MCQSCKKDEAGFQDSRFTDGSRLVDVASWRLHRAVEVQASIYDSSGAYSTWCMPGSSSQTKATRLLTMAFCYKHMTPAIFGVLALAIASQAAFTPCTIRFFGSDQSHFYQRNPHRVISPLGSTGGSGGEESSSLNDLKRMLEASWDVQTMGAVPSSPETAADAAANSLITAVDSGKKLVFVNLLLPSYDITQGFNMYDDISAVEFCIELIKCMEQKGLILVRDEKSLKSVSRVLDVKERNRVEEQRQQLLDSVKSQEDNDDDDDDDGEEEDDSRISEGSGSDRSTVSSAEGDKEKEAPPSSTSDVDAFRQQLMTSWKPSEDEKEGALPQPQKSSVSQPSDPEKNFMPRTYRIASMLGDDAWISKGPDMPNQVVTALRNNGLPSEDEQAIVILSSFTKEEMVAVRAIVAKYSGSKTIVMVNCKFDSLPRELSAGETVYSLLPLVARPVVSDTNVLGKSKKDDDEPTPTKIVLMRRYPGDWELYVDGDDSGFELVDSIKPSLVGQTGPGMDWVALVVKKYMQSQFGKK